MPLCSGGWGPPFTWDPVDRFFAFAVSPWNFDPDYIHCYPVSFDGLAPLSPPPQDACTTITHVVPYANYSRELPDSPVKVGGSSHGDGAPTCCGACSDHPNCSAWVHDSQKRLDGKQCHLYSCVTQWVPPDVIGGQDGRYLSGGLESQCADMLPPAPGAETTGGYVHQQGWWGLGQRMDWYDLRHIYYI
eukprot:COSAG01_NODE_8001_length_2958_cov_1.785939_2_plen_189_part_00